VKTVAERRPFLLRIDATVLEALQRWASDDLRSLNGQIDFLLRQALRASGRFRNVTEPPGPTAPPGAAGPTGRVAPGDKP
jgi:hypothetical protein